MGDAAADTMEDMESDVRTCGGCGAEIRRGEPVFVFDEVRFHVACVPAEHSSRAQSLLGVKSC